MQISLDTRFISTILHDLQRADTETVFMERLNTKASLHSPQTWMVLINLLLLLVQFLYHLNTRSRSTGALVLLLTGRARDHQQVTSHIGAVRVRVTSSAADMTRRQDFVR